MTKPTRLWLPMLALCVWAGAALAASEEAHKKKEEPKAAPHKTESPKPEAAKPAAKPEAAKPAPVAAPATAAKPSPMRAAPMRRAPVRRPALARRTTPPVTVTASPEPPASPASPSTAVIHLVTHSADGTTANGLPVPGEITRMIEARERAERDRMERAHLDREREAREQMLAERERALAAREAALRKPDPEPEPLPVVRKRVDRAVLTNEGLVKLADAGYDEAFLMELIRRRPSKFDTTVEGLSYLMQAGLTQQLVRTVLAVDEWERARKAEELAGAVPPAPVAGGSMPPPPPAAIPAGMKEVRQKVMVPQGQLRAGERGVMMLAPSGERWYWVPDGSANR